MASGEQGFDFALQCARRLHQLDRLLTEVYENRCQSLYRVFSEWQGDEKDKRLEQDRDHRAVFITASAELKKCGDKMVQQWFASVDEYNQSTREEAVRTLQAELDRYHGGLFEQQNWAGQLGLHVAHSADEVADFASFGMMNIVVDDAGPVVPQPRPAEDGGWRPSAPDYLVEHPVYVRYERASHDDPRQGMTDYYEYLPALLHGPCSTVWGA